MAHPGGDVPGAALPPPSNPLVGSMMTDFYQITMCYAYWKAGKTEDGETLQLRVDILEAELDGAKMAAFDRLVRKKDAEKDEALLRQAAEKDAENEAALAALRAELIKD